MKINGFYQRTLTNENSEYEITFLVSGEDKHLARYAVDSLKKQDKKLAIEIKEYRKARSLDSNAYMWVLLEKMAQKLKTNKDDLYIIMLERYGVFTHLIVKPNIVDRVKSEWRTVKELGEVTINGQTGIQLQCYFGSSSYDTKEMSRLIDGVVNECKDLNIETLSDTELKKLMEDWGEKHSTK